MYCPDCGTECKNLKMPINQCPNCRKIWREITVDIDKYRYEEIK